MLFLALVVSCWTISCPTVTAFAPRVALRSISIKVYYTEDLVLDDPAATIRDAVAKTNQAFTRSDLPVKLNLICVEEWKNSQVNFAEVDLTHYDHGQYIEAEEVWMVGLLESKDDWETLAGSADAVVLLHSDCKTKIMELADGLAEPIGILGVHSLLDQNALGHVVGMFLDVWGVNGGHSWWRDFGQAPLGQTVSPDRMGTAEYEAIRRKIAETAPSVADNGDESKRCPGFGCVDDEVFCRHRVVCRRPMGKEHCPKMCGHC